MPSPIREPSIAKATPGQGGAVPAATVARRTDAGEGSP